MPTGRQPNTIRRKKRKEATSANQEQTREDTAGRILSTATRLFADQGYHGTSVKDICDSAGVNIAAVHYHFGSKENLYRRIIEQFAMERLESARKTLETPRNVEDLKVRLEIFLRQVIEALLKQTDVAILIQRGIEMLDSMSEAIFRNSIIKLFETLVEFLLQAKKNGLLDHNVDPFFAAGLLRSQFLHHTRYDAVMKKYYGYSLKDEKYRRQWIEQTIRIFMEGVAARRTGLPGKEV